MVPKSTWRPSKKLSPMMMQVDPPDVQPSDGEMALMQGMAEEGYRPGYSAGKEAKLGECQKQTFFETI